MHFVSDHRWIVYDRIVYKVIKITTRHSSELLSAIYKTEIWSKSHVHFNDRSTKKINFYYKIVVESVSIKLHLQWSMSAIFSPEYIILHSDSVFGSGIFRKRWDLNVFIEFRVREIVCLQIKSKESFHRVLTTFELLGREFIVQNMFIDPRARCRKYNIHYIMWYDRVCSSMSRRLQQHVDCSST